MYIYACKFAKKNVHALTRNGFSFHVHTCIIHIIYSINNCTCGRRSNLHVHMHLHCLLPCKEIRNTVWMYILHSHFIMTPDMYIHAQSYMYIHTVNVLEHLLSPFLIAPLWFCNFKVCVHVVVHVYSLTLKIRIIRTYMCVYIVHIIIIILQTFFKRVRALVKGQAYMYLYIVHLYIAACLYILKAGRYCHTYMYNVHVGTCMYFLCVPPLVQVYTCTCTYMYIISLISFLLHLSSHVYTFMCTCKYCWSSEKSIHAGMYIHVVHDHIINLLGTHGNKKRTCYSVVLVRKKQTCIDYWLM